MAKAEKVMVPVLTTIEVEKIRLDLDVKEAHLLLDMLSHASGCPRKSRRGIANNIYKSLADVTPKRGWTDRSDITGESNIHFNESV